MSTSPSLSWRRQDTYRTGGLLLVVLLLHGAAFGILALLVVPRHYAVGTQVFGFGLGVTAYTLGMRHAFDADHIAAIDNTTRKLMAEGKRPLSVGFWFALGHASVVVVLAVLVALGAQGAMRWADDSSGLHRVLSTISTTASGGFLYLIGILNLVALIGIGRVFRELRRGRFDEAELEARLDSRGFLARVLGRLTRSIRRPGQMYLVGLLFGIGFDTATEVLLLALAGSSGAAGLPWYAVVCLPLLFAAGMSLFDTLDGTFMNFAYHWAFANPVRKVYYNLTITGLSVVVALVVGTIELVGVAKADLGWSSPVTDWIAGLDLGNVGYLVVGLFVVVWVVAITYWRVARVEHRWGGETSA
ncbi:HoxN/HupN/NixA family nickel/cobalt transporter [Amycolatopsis cynarae]|uniref:Nickel/cobalt efflux system n=1 Tax=Amycolatopsis cynarae TaxID=2995223 RepID=A0ABY7AUP9_9PSEU|nr:HoxN/HupN/NixA family nickel/cobalt transporter [Amycolatopsis sp. HUAS 11-8]WAL63243.1 HoxN/HupN/NixA family nickel/cobalt transporter [Amycolatopsis sp. HUAS 11-8]